MAFDHDASRFVGEHCAVVRLVYGLASFAETFYASPFEVRWIDYYLLSDLGRVLWGVRGGAEVEVLERGSGGERGEESAEARGQGEKFWQHFLLGVWV